MGTSFESGYAGVFQGTKRELRQPPPPPLHPHPHPTPAHHSHTQPCPPHRQAKKNRQSANKRLRRPRRASERIRARGTKRRRGVRKAERGERQHKKKRREDRDVDGSSVSLVRPIAQLFSHTMIDLTFSGGGKRAP